MKLPLILREENRSLSTKWYSKTANSGHFIAFRRKLPQWNILYLDQKHLRRAESHGVSSKRIHRLSFIPDLFSQLCKIFTEEKNNINFAYHNLHITDIVYCKYKAETSMTDWSNLVYKIPCEDCLKWYVGKTKQSLKNRVQQHAYD